MSFLPAKTNQGFTLIELLVAISIISLLSAVTLTKIVSVRAKARDARRVDDVHQIELGLRLYEDANGTLPLTGGVSCLGMDSAGTCWTNVTGSTTLQNALSPYMKFPIDPSPTRGNGDRYLYLDGNFAYNCTASTTYGKFILWKPEATVATHANCLGVGVRGCCGSVPCESAHFCGYQVGE